MPAIRWAEHVTEGGVGRPGRCDRRLFGADRLQPVLSGTARHGLFAVLLAVGIALRVATQLTYRPAILYYDSFTYLADAVDLEPRLIRPFGYSAFIRPFLAFDNLAVLPLVNHLMALGMAVLIYVVLVRRRVWPPLAALATAPVLLSAYHLVVEQMIMADVLFETLLVMGVTVLVWRRLPGYAAAASGGLLFGLATTTRLIGQPMVLAGVVFLLLVGGRLRRRLLAATVLVVAFAAPLVAYAGYNAVGRGEFQLTARGPTSLYARAATVADCGTLSLPDYERQLCPARMDVKPKKGSVINGYFYKARAMEMHGLPAGVSKSDALRDFAMRVITQQPLDVGRSVGADLLHGFSWEKTRRPGQLPIERWRFHDVYPVYGSAERNQVAVDYYGGAGPAVNVELARLLRSYQMTVGYTLGPVLALALGLGLAGAATGFSARHPPGLPAACLLWAGTGVGLVFTATVFLFSWRYQLPAIVFLPAAGALGLTALLRTYHARS